MVPPPCVAEAAGTYSRDDIIGPVGREQKDRYATRGKHGHLLLLLLPLPALSARKAKPRLGSAASQIAGSEDTVCPWLVRRDGTNGTLGLGGMKTESCTFSRRARGKNGIQSHTWLGKQPLCLLHDPSGEVAGRHLKILPVAESGSPCGILMRSLSASLALSLPLRVCPRLLLRVLLALGIAASDAIRP